MAMGRRPLVAIGAILAALALFVADPRVEGALYEDRHLSGRPCSLSGALSDDPFDGACQINSTHGIGANNRFKLTFGGSWCFDWICVASLCLETEALPVTGVNASWGGREDQKKKKTKKSYEHHPTNRCNQS